MHARGLLATFDQSSNQTHDNAAANEPLRPIFGSSSQHDTLSVQPLHDVPRRKSAQILAIKNNTPHHGQDTPCHRPRSRLVLQTLHRAAHPLFSPSIGARSRMTIPRRCANAVDRLCTILPRLLLLCLGCCLWRIPAHEIRARRHPSGEALDCVFLRLLLFSVKSPPKRHTHTNTNTLLSRSVMTWKENAALGYRGGHLSEEASTNTSEQRPL